MFNLTNDQIKSIKSLIADYRAECDARPSDLLDYDFSSVDAFLDQCTDIACKVLCDELVKLGLPCNTDVIDCIEGM